jgi:hypothetical protein
MKIYSGTLVVFFMAVMCLGANAAADYRVLTEGLRLEPAKYLAETINVVETRIRAWDEALEKEQAGIKRLISGPYGSAFLRFNKKGIDQDYLCVFDLGELEDGSSEQQALELVARLNKLFTVIRRVNNALPNTAVLYVYNHGPTDSKGNIKISRKLASLMGAQIEAIKTGRQIPMAFPDSMGRLVPSDVYPFELVLPVNTRLKIATNTVKYYENMFSGIRDVSLQFFFTVGIKTDKNVIELNVSPLYDPAGTAISFFDAMAKVIFLYKEHVEIYKKRLMHLPAQDIMLHSVIDLYRAAVREHNNGHYLKQIKRLHQTYNGLQWAFSPSDRAEIEAIMENWLHSEWAITAPDLVEQPTMWLKADKTMRDTLIKAGSLDALLEFLVEAVKLEITYPQLKSEVNELRITINDLKKADNLPKNFARLKRIGEKVSRKIEPTKKEMAQLLQLFTDKLNELGFKSLNIYKTRNQKLFVSRRQVLAAGLVPEKANLPAKEGGIKKVGGYDYFVIDRLGTNDVPVKTIVFRAVFSGGPAEKFDAYYAALAAHTRF